ncbi:hypothetical protein L5B88_29950, partial [Pseudomonas aeruginosa]|nr:hypothetical protein [Pseudomonas aeruginosa]
MWDELENALAWYAAAPGRWIESGKKDLAAAAEWIWVVLQGDFADEQTTAQIATGTVISMIPIADQLCDIRDLIANCRKIHAEPDNSWAWIALLLTLIGLFPVLGSLAKGCCKILFAYGRKFAVKAGAKIRLDQFWDLSRPYVEASIGKLNEHLKTRPVRWALKLMRIDNAYSWVASQVRAVIGKLNLQESLRAFDGLIDATRELIKLVEHWGSRAIASRIGQMLNQVIEVRNLANTKLEAFLAPVRQWLEKLARRLDIEADMAYRAQVNAVNPHGYSRPQLKNDEIEFDLNKPGWVDETGRLANKPMDIPPIKEGWPDISKSAPKPLENAYKTFKDAKGEKVYPGETIYRIVDPSSADNSICWMREAEFKALTSRDDWRRRFAVWRYWNRNGEYVTYTVPPGDPLRVWEGKTASQRLHTTSEYVLEGGGMQLVIDPTHLQLENFGKRRPTTWGYTDFQGESNEFLGLPK